MKKALVFCQHCQTQTIYTTDNFSRCHLKKEHNMTVKEYYDLYLKKDGEDICLVCGKTNKFENMTLGYRSRCSNECRHEDIRDRNGPINKKMRKSKKNVDEVQADLKRRKTCMDRYGVDYISKNDKAKEKTKETCLERYGQSTTLQLDVVKSARLTALEENAYEINERRKSWWTPENTEKVSNTRIETLLDRYGVGYVHKIQGVKEKIAETNYNNGYWTPIENKDEWDKYCFLVKKETDKHVKELFENWNGTCYYFGHKLTQDNGVYDPYSITIDHKVSKKSGFCNGIPPEEIGDISNLCICSRLINCVKNSLTEQEFYESERYKILHERFLAINASS